MVILGIDPGYRNTGYCMLKFTNGHNKAELVGKGTVRVKNRKDWPSEMLELIAKLDKAVTDLAEEPTHVGVEQIAWHGRKKGVLQLAHLAGGIAADYRGYSVFLFLPRNVKSTTREYGIPPGFNEHEADALSLCRLVLDQVNVRKKKAAKLMVDL